MKRKIYNLHLGDFVIEMTKEKAVIKTVDNQWRIHFGYRLRAYQFLLYLCEHDPDMVKTLAQLLYSSTILLLSETKFMEYYIKCQQEYFKFIENNSSQLPKEEDDKILSEEKLKYYSNFNKQKK